MPNNEPQSLRLLDALIRWSDPGFVEAVRCEERKLIAYELHQVQRPKLTPETEWKKPTERSWMIPTDFTFISTAWRDLENDFAARIEAGAIYLAGVSASANAAAEPEPIPAAWASDLVFDFSRNTAARQNQRYVAVRVSKVPLNVQRSPTRQQATTDASCRTTFGPITPETLRALTDDEVLLLLEDHARRVIEGPDAKLIAPGKISLLPLIRRKMLHRFEQNETRETLGAEAHALAEWIASKVPSHQAPTASTIEKVLRGDYRRPNRRSTPEIR